MALITGCFDIVHLGHLQLFEFAKSKSDFVIVGLDNDESIKLTKGMDRPLNKIQSRIEFLSKLTDIDYLFEIGETFLFGSKESLLYLDNMTIMISPNYLVTNPIADSFWKEKQTRAERICAKLLMNNVPRYSSSSEVIRKIESEL